MRGVYVIEEVGGARCKIGIATDPRKRIHALQTGHSRRLVIVAVWRAANAAGLEKAVHSALQQFRIVGEWFAVTPAMAGFAVGEASARGGFDAVPVNPAEFQITFRRLQEHNAPQRIEGGWPPLPGATEADGPLRRWRLAVGISQRDLAAKLNTKHSTVSRMEAGVTRPSRAMTMRLMALTGLSADELLLQPRKVA